MDVKDLIKKAIQVREKYARLEMQKYGKTWTDEQIMQGLVGDIGDLAKLVLGKSGVREIENLDEKLAHELADCLWCLMILANNYNVDLEKSFLETMDELDKRIDMRLCGK